LRQVRYLSARWIDAARQAIAADASLPAALAGVTLTVEQTVEDGPDGTVSWHIAIVDGAASLVPGPAEKPDLRFTTAYGTAAQIASGALAAQLAFVEGRLRVGGDLSLLIAHQRAIAAVDDALAPVRADTTYE
jgi:SCP-2 sterol transfer family